MIYCPGILLASILNGAIGNFSYGIQAGSGGFNISGGSTVNGDIYSVGDTKASGGGTITGTAYCNMSSDSSVSCNTSRSSSVLSLPFSTSSITSIQNQATAGTTYTGNYNVGYAGATIGPEKITGNLVVNGGGTLTLSGVVWVQGSLSVSNGGQIKLASSYGSSSGVILANGLVSLSGGSLSGSSQSGSYLTIITTATGTNALGVTGGAGAVILVAQNGTATLSGGVNANQVTAQTISISGGSTITYSNGLANLIVSDGPTSFWNVNSWSETSN